MGERAEAGVAERVGHTPGPWELDPHNAEGSFTIYAPEGWVIVQRPPIIHRADASSANGRLIAAAPDMLAALKVIIDNEHRRLTGGAANEPTLREVIDALDAGRRAIAKAEGR